MFLSGKGLLPHWHKPLDWLFSDKVSMFDLGLSDESFAAPRDGCWELNGIALLHSVMMFVDWSLVLVGVLGPWSVSCLVCHLHSCFTGTGLP